MKTIGRNIAEWPKIDAEGRKRGWGSWGGVLIPPHQLGGTGERCELSQQGSGQSPDCPKEFPLFTALLTASPDATIGVLLIAEHKRNWRILFPFNLESIIVHLVTSNDVLVYETKFTVEKSKEMVFIAGKRRVRWGGEARHFEGNSPRDETLLCDSDEATSPAIETARHQTTSSIIITSITGWPGLVTMETYDVIHDASSSANERGQWAGCGCDSDTGRVQPELHQRGTGQSGTGRRGVQSRWHTSSMHRHYTVYS